MKLCSGTPQLNKELKKLAGLMVEKRRDFISFLNYYYFWPFLGFINRIDKVTGARDREGDDMQQRAKGQALQTELLGLIFFLGYN